MKITKTELLKIIKEEILKEAGHTDVPSSKSDLLTIGEDAAEILQAHQMVPEGSDSQLGGLISLLLRLHI